MVLVMKYFSLHIFCILLANILVNCSTSHDRVHFRKLHGSSLTSYVPFNGSKSTHTFNHIGNNFSLHKNERSLLGNILSDTQRKCLKDVLYILKNLKSEWAMKMLDSYGKIPSGVLLGNLLWMGKYDECAKIEVTKSENGTSGFHGLYCISQWNISVPNKIILPMQEIPVKSGICLPDSCRSIDVKSDISHIIDLLYLLPVIKNYEVDLKLTSLACNSRNSYLNTPAILFLTFFGLYLLLPITGSLLTIIRYFSNQTKSSISSVRSLNSLISNNELITHEESLIQIEREECEDDQANFMEHNNNNFIKRRMTEVKMERCLKRVSKPLKCFCLFTNAAQILNTNSSKRQFSCLHGLRFFSMTWVILGHTYIHNVNYIDNYMDLLRGIDNLPFQAVMQGTFSVDTFFLIGGFLLGYMYLEEADKRNGKINWLGLCLHRLLRLTPVYLFLIGFATLIFNYLGSGQFWEEATDVAMCREYWWWNVLYINNFLPLNFMCLTWTWYLANDMQFFIVSSGILYVLWRWKYIGIGMFSSILICSWIITFYLSSIYGISPFFVGLTEVKNYTEYQGRLIVAWDLLYDKPYCRIGPHIVGIFLACIIHYNANMKFAMPMAVQLLGWCIAIFFSASVIYGLYHVNPSSPLLNVYNAFGRTAFSLGIAWLIFCCLTGNAGLVNDLLSYKLWIPLSRLTYCAYLFHPLVMNFYFQLRETPLFFTHTTMVVLFFSFLLISYGVAFVISITFEAPLINLEKLMYKR